MSSKKILPTLPWDTAGYIALAPGDLLPTPAPTPEQRIRVAAALATRLRDSNMLDAAALLSNDGRASDGPHPNAETIRGVLLMDADAWARDIGSIAAGLVMLGIDRYDGADPRTRFEQTRRHYIGV
jgi:hypothetical protein